MKHFHSLLLFFVFTIILCSCQVKKDKTPQVEPVVEDTLVTHKISLLFVGDLMQHLPQINAVKTENGYDYSGCFQHVKQEISAADIAIGNFETTLGGKPYAGYPQFSAPDDFMSDLKEVGFDVLLTANNHCLDRYKKGLERTIQMLDSFDIAYAGTYINAEEREKKYPLLIEQDGFRLSFLTYTYDTNGLEVKSPNVVNYIDKEVMAKDIETAKSQNPDLIIACMHWGLEYKSLPNSEQKELAQWLLDNGVDHIIGSHPHVLQPMELRTDSLTGKKNIVVYSLGNFISNQQQRRTDGGAMLRLELQKDSVISITNCKYSLVWVAHPDRPRRKYHTLIPAGYPVDSLSATEKSKFELFINDSRKHLQKHNKEIDEYLF